MAAAGLILLFWIIWGVYWLAASRGVKAVRRRESRWIRWLFLAQALVTAVLLGHRRWTGWLGMQLVPGGWTRYWIAVAVTATGLFICIWARRALADNWSGTVTVKVDHELVQTGPYRWIRHPIYTGILTMMLGTALAGGRVHGLLALPVAAVAFWLRSRVEERWMTEEFGERYEQYRKNSWGIVPFLA